MGPSALRATVTSLGVGLVLLLGACAGAGSVVVVGGDGGAGACPADQHADTTGTCVAGPPPECEAGSMKAPGELVCAPIGWSDCEGGFEKDPSGWGCKELLAEGCTGATRAALGQKSCVPVGDCNAPFPPANATRIGSGSVPLPDPLPGPKL